MQRSSDGMVIHCLSWGVPGHLMLTVTNLAGNPFDNLLWGQLINAAPYGIFLSKYIGILFGFLNFPMVLMDG